jgi:hypothetical protein
MAGKGRQTANEVAGEPIPAHSKKEAKGVAGVPPASQKIVAPLFNLVRSLLFHNLSMFIDHMTSRWTILNTPWQVWVKH